MSDKDSSLILKVKEAPTSPGVYLMKDASGKVIYVGKALSLRARLKSYFQKSEQVSPKTQYMIQHVEDIELILSGTELEALLLEHNLIKKWKPKFNIRLRDDKAYPFIKIDYSHPFPRPMVARKQVKGENLEYFGPFPNGYALRQTLELGSKIFQLRDCRDHDFANRSRPCLSYQIHQCTAPCVKYVDEQQYAAQLQDFKNFLKSGSSELLKKWQEDMQLASDNMDFELAAKLRDRIKAVEVIVGQQQRMVDTVDHIDKDVWAVAPENIQELEQQSHLDILILQFRAGLCVGKVFRSAEISQGLAGEHFGAQLLFQHYAKQSLPSIVIVPDTWLERLEKSVLEKALVENSYEEQKTEVQVKIASEEEGFAKLYDLARENVQLVHEEQSRNLERDEEALRFIAQILDLSAPPTRMECVDISNFQGQENVASAVVFVRGRPDKSQYRHYKIQGFDGQNDFASMKEVMSRRFGKPDSPRPDLLVIDGGKGQLSSVVEILKELHCDFPVVALAKARTQRNFKAEEVETTEERLFVPGQKNYIKIKNTQALRVLTHLRDEAHRFAIEFHRQRRGY